MCVNLAALSTTHARYNNHSSCSLLGSPEIPSALDSKGYVKLSFPLSFFLNYFDVKRLEYEAGFDNGQYRL